MFKNIFYLLLTLLIISSCSVTLNNRYTNDDLYYSQTDNGKTAIIDENLLNEIDSATNNRNPYNEVLIDNYNDARQKRLDVIYSPNFGVNYYNINDAWFYASSYDPMFYNIIVVRNQVWVEPNWLTTQFGIGYRYNIYNSNWYYNDYYYFDYPYYRYSNYYGYRYYGYNNYYSRYYNSYHYPYNNYYTNRTRRSGIINSESYQKPSNRNDYIRKRPKKKLQKEQHIRRNINVEKTKYSDRKNHIRRRSTYKNVKPAVRKRYNSNDNYSRNRKINTRNSSIGNNTRSSTLNRGSINKGSSNSGGSRKRK